MFLKLPVTTRAPRHSPGSQVHGQRQPSAWPTVSSPALSAALRGRGRQMKGARSSRRQCSRDWGPAEGVAPLLTRGDWGAQRGSLAGGPLGTPAQVLLADSVGGCSEEMSWQRGF